MVGAGGRDGGCFDRLGVVTPSLLSSLSFPAEAGGGGGRIGALPPLFRSSIVGDFLVVDYSYS